MAHGPSGSGINQRPMKCHTPSIYVLSSLDIVECIQEAVLSHRASITHRAKLQHKTWLPQKSSW